MKGSTWHCQQFVDRLLVLLHTGSGPRLHLRHAYVGVLDFSVQWYVCQGFCDVFPNGCEVSSSFPSAQRMGSLLLPHTRLGKALNIEVGVLLEALLDKVLLGRMAFSCHFSLCCAKKYLPYQW